MVLSTNLTNYRIVYDQSIILSNQLINMIYTIINKHKKIRGVIGRIFPTFFICNGNKRFLINNNTTMLLHIIKNMLKHCVLNINGINGKDF